jgi:EmrB/QacA subfamily drug resistance transporter
MSAHAEPNPAPVAPDAYPQRWWILLVIALPIFVIALDNTILNVALPTLAQVFNASASEQKWMIEAYILVFAGLLLTGGTLSDRYGARPLLLIGLAIFGAASLAAAFASSTLMLILSRAVMGLGGALLYPGTLAIIKQIFPADERPRAVAIWTATASIGAAAGPVIGGLLLELFWWGAIFLVNLPVALLTAVAGWRMIPDTQARREVAIDWAGTLLSIGGVGALVFGIIESPSWGWSSPTTLLTLLSAVLLLAGFVWWQLRAPAPMLDVQLFRNPRFSAASQAIIATYFSIAGAAFALAQYLQFVRGYGPFEAGLRTAPLALAVLVAALVAAPLIARLGSTWVLVGGLGTVVMGFLTLSQTSADSTYTAIMVAQILLGLGAGVTATAAFDSVLSAVPAAQAGSASAVNETGIELGNALGIAGLGTMLTASYTRSLLAAEGLPEQARAAAAESISAAVRMAEELGGPDGAALLEQARVAFSTAMDETALFGAAVVALSGLVAFVALPRRARPAASAEHHSITSQ